MNAKISLTEGSDLRDAVRERYAEVARTVTLRPGGSGGCCQPEAVDPAAVASYKPDEIQSLPQDAVLASLGCGNPTALAGLNPGEVVLDLGSGGGIDVLLSARRVGPDGFAYGLDMTDEMLALAERNRAQAGVENVRFLKGHIEAIPLPDDSVDVIISNCVINLSTDKDQVLREAWRVLRPGGRFAVSDIVLGRELPESIQRDLSAWSSCVAGALTESDYRQKLHDAGFADIDVEITHTYDAGSLFGDSCGCCGGSDTGDATSEDLDGTVLSAFVRATKPGQSS
jgi:arsenite methyltransferase